MADQQILPPLTTDLSKAIAAVVGATPALAPLTPPPPGGDGGTPTGLTKLTFGQTQKYIAYTLLSILIGVIAVIMFVSILYTRQCSNAADCTQAGNSIDLLIKSLSPIFSAMIGLVGPVVGFYFASRKV